MRRYLPVDASPTWVRMAAETVNSLLNRATALETATDWAALGNYANDTAAAAGGVAVGELYRNGSVVMVRVA